MSRVDDRTQAALDARIREAREMASSDEPWEWDPAAFEHGAAKLFGENLDAAGYGAAPVVPGFQPRREYETEEALLARVRPFVSAYAGIEPEAFDSAARDALEDHAGFKARWLRARERRGESPVSGDFLAERKSLEAEVESIPEGHALRDFANRAVDALDGNPGWGYAAKVKALRVLRQQAERLDRACAEE